jgi:prepilin-type processing-associated H-X9-DG protein
MKMYSNESKGERMPPNSFMWYVHPDLPKADPLNDTNDNILTTFSPRITYMYPEYMPDPAILICPSDSDNGIREATNLNCVAMSDEFVCQGSGDLNDLGSGDVEAGILHATDGSYTYLGWVFDKFGVNQTLGDNINPGDNTFTIANILTLIGLTEDYSPVIAPSQPAQVFNRFLDNWIVDCLFGALTGADKIDCVNQQADNDWDGILAPPNAIPPLATGDPYGTGDSDTVFRLREGIERFLITDINNPGASAKAQSQIFIMFDNVATVAAEYNHVPGGSNVLYLDGHVTFVRYPGPDDSPVTTAAAQFFGTVSQVV